MIKKILGTCLLVGLILTTTNGSEMVERATAEHPLNPSSPYFVEKSKEILSYIIEHNLLLYMGRYDKLTDRNRQIDQMLRLFTDHLNHDQQPCEGYGLILEDIRAHPDSDEVLRQLSQMDELISLVNSGTLSLEALTRVKASLDQRKQSAIATRLGIALQRIMQFRTAKKLNTDLMFQTKTEFEKDLEKLRRYRDEAVVSKWTLESPLQTELAASAPAIETPLPIFADVIRDAIELTQTIKAEEVAYLKATIALLTDNRNKTMILLEEASALEEKSLREESIVALEKDIAKTSSFIAREQARLKNLEAPEIN